MRYQYFRWHRKWLWSFELSFWDDPLWPQAFSFFSFISVAEQEMRSWPRSALVCRTSRLALLIWLLCRLPFSWLKYFLNKMFEVYFVYKTAKCLYGVNCLSLVTFSFQLPLFFVSPDGGMSIYWLTTFPGNSTIMVFTFSASDGTFAFLTDNQEVRFFLNGYEFTETENIRPKKERSTTTFKLNLHSI